MIRSPEDLENMALNVYNMKQVLIPFRAFLLWGDIKKYFFEHHSYFWASFYQKKKKPQEYHQMLLSLWYPSGNNSRLP